MSTQTEPLVMGGRVKSMKSKFESLSSLESLDISGALKTAKPKPFAKFQRSATSFDLFASNKPMGVHDQQTTTSGVLNNFRRPSSDTSLSKLENRTKPSKIVPLNEIKENVEQVSRLTRQTSDPTKRSSIRRSPAFRVGEKIIKTVATKVSKTVTEEDTPEKFLKRSVDDEKFLQPGITDTLKAALRQPLPIGPPPKKPPRTFESPKENINTIQLFEDKILKDKESKEKTEHSNGKKEPKSNVEQKSAKSEMKGRSVPSNLLSCIRCTTPIYDAVVPHTKDSLNNATKSIPSEHIYMEPFSHLKEIVPNVPDIVTSSTPVSSHSDWKSKASDCSCPEDHNGTGDLHYLCTSIDNSITSNDSTTAEDQPNSLTNTYDEINILVNAAFCDKSMDNSSTASSTPSPTTSHKLSAKVSRSLTEKRKTYVRRVSKKTEPITYGTLHRTFKSPVLKTFSFDDFGDNESPCEKTETTSNRIQKYNELVEATANNSSVRRRKDISTTVKSEHESGTLNDVDASKGYLFQMCLLVGYNTSNNSAYIKSKYPDDDNVPQNIETLIFPNKSLLQHGKENQNYSLILTNDMGFRIYGYCRRVLPESCELCLPLAYCLISQVKAPGFYFKILKEIESRHGQSDCQTQFLLKGLQHLAIPEPGKFLHLKCPLSSRPKTIFMSNHKISPKRLSLEVNPKWLTESATQAVFQESEYSQGVEKNGKKPGFKSLVQEFEQKKQEKAPFDFGLINRSLLAGRGGGSKIDEIFIRRPNDLRLESTEISDLYRILGAETLINVFGSLLLERKVILYGRNISTLSSCVLGLQTILYPFQWQHTLVTLLPHSLIEVCQAPLPLLTGVLDEINLEIEDGIIIDLDTRQVLQKCGDEATILPSTLRESLKVSLEMVDLLDQGKMLSSVLIAEAFLRFFVELFAGYKNKTFEKDVFIQSHNCKYVRLFLEWFVETAMFRHFMNTKYLPNASDSYDSNHYALFDARLLEKSENKTRVDDNIETIMKNSKIINKKTKTFKDRFKEFIHSN
ncbi:DENN domain-containing protein 2C [Pseudolycoriella hygida]|uniref:DENN domain-containing protein 2C n=1 Tax=Pseudolycoriella hygida TaxID=35572 RepID=A0A9Q0N6N5_9DIPT|nr:DENN domain-containing protein 2C [Pseudolycoriella hygida]